MVHARTRSVCCGLLFGVSWEKVKACLEESLYSLGFLWINFGREFSDLFLTSSTSQNSHRFDVQKKFLGHMKIT